MKKLKKLIINALVLTCASFMMRTVSVSFNVYISNKIGAAGMGLFSLINSVYSFALTFATSGIFIAATRLSSVALGKNDKSEVKAAMKKCFIYSLSFGSAAALLLFSLAGPIGTVILKDSRTVFPLRLLAFTLPVISMSSAMNGYFTAVRRVYKNAASQIFEQGIKISLTVYALNMLAPDGIEAACVAIVASGAVSELASFLFIFAEYLIDKRIHMKTEQTAKNGKYLTRSLLGIALPTAFSTYARSGLSTIEHILIPRGLELSGASKDRSLAAYGTLNSMVLPIVLFPSAVISSFSGLLVPELAECQVQKNKAEIKYILSRVFQLSLLFSIGVAGVLICFSGELGLMIYDSAEAGEYIRKIAPLVPIMYLDTTTDAMLKGLGEQVYTMNVNLIDSALGVLLVLTLLPPFGIQGYIAVIFICEIINAAMSIYRLLKVGEIEPNIIRIVFAPLLCICGATSSVKILSRIAHFPHISDPKGLVLCIMLSVILYIFFAYLTGCISKDDIKWVKQIFKK